MVLEDAFFGQDYEVVVGVKSHNLERINRLVLREDPLGIILQEIDFMDWERPLSLPLHPSKFPLAVYA